jgi:mannose-6-phosphate isomerase
MSQHLVKKPWGKELWIELNDAYCYKRIWLKKGHRTSLQFHERKLETNYVIRGKGWLEYGPDMDNLQTIEISAGSHFTLKPNEIHRITAITPIILQEVSTPEINDVIRLHDDTNRGDGRIDDEHVR